MVVTGRRPNDRQVRLKRQAGKEGGPLHPITMTEKDSTKHHLTAADVFLLLANLSFHNFSWPCDNGAAAKACFSGTDFLGAF